MNTRDEIIRARYPQFFISAAEKMQNTMEVYIYYFNGFTVRDHAFERAAKWALNFTPLRNRTSMIIPVTTKAGFMRAWLAVLREARSKNITIAAMHLFTHASLDGSVRGLEFSDRTLSLLEIECLPNLPWHEHGFIYLHGCNTGKSSKTGKSPAEIIAKAQGIPAGGQDAFAFFSRRVAIYQEIRPIDKEIYLFSYHHGRNAAFYWGNERRIETRWYGIRQR